MSSLWPWPRVISTPSPVGWGFGTSPIPWGGRLHRWSRLFIPSSDHPIYINGLIFTKVFHEYVAVSYIIPHYTIYKSLQYLSLYHLQPLQYLSLYHLQTLTISLIIPFTNRWQRFLSTDTRQNTTLDYSTLISFAMQPCISETFV